MTLTVGGLPMGRLIMPKREHASFKWVNTAAEEQRPMQLPLSRRQFDILYGLALSLGIEPKRTWLSGHQHYVAQLIKEIADGRLLVVRPDN